MLSRVEDTILTRYYYRSLSSFERIEAAQKTIKILKGNGMKLGERHWTKYEKIMYVLLRKVDDEGCVFTTLQELAEDCHYSSPKPVAKFLQILDDNGLIYRRNGLIMLTFLDEFMEEKRSSMDTIIKYSSNSL